VCVLCCACCVLTHVVISAFGEIAHLAIVLPSGIQRFVACDGLCTLADKCTQVMAVMVARASTAA
jgi:hypothetical protein